MSAPLGLDRTETVPMGCQTAWIENSNPRPSPQRAEWTQHPDGGGADLRVCSAGPESNENRSHGLPRNLDRKLPIRVHPHNAPSGPSTPVAGGRTSLSAPLDMDRTKTAPWATNPPGSETPIRALHTTRQKGPTHGWRGGGPPCPLRWTSLCKPPPQWAVHPPGSEPHPHSIAKHLKKSKVRHPPKPFPEGEIFHSPAAVLFFKGMGIRKAENGGQERPGECRSAQERRGQRNDRF